MKIKFLALNIWHGGIVWEKLIKFVNQEKPDIAVFQEVHSSENKSLEKRFRTMQEFQKEFPWLAYSAFEETMIEKNTKSLWGNAVFSKFPIKNKKGYLFDGKIFEYDFKVNDPDPSSVTEGMLGTQIEINNKNYFIYSLHGVWDTHGNDTPKRFAMEKVIVDALKGNEDIILAGDTNLYPTTQFVKNLEDKLNIRNIFGNRLRSSFNMKYKTNPSFAKAVVDMIFISENIKVLKAYKPMVDVSDHYPLIATLEV